MNKCLFIGRLTADPEIRYSQGSNTAIANYNLAVDRIFKKDGEPTADFPRCVAFGKNAEFAEKYLHKGMKIAVEAHVQSGSYVDNDGKRIYTTDFVVDRQEFCESKGSGGNNYQGAAAPAADDDGFMNMEEGLEDLPFN